MVKQRGGRRPGAGRPIATKTLETQEQRRLLVAAIAPHIEDIVAALADKAKKGDVAAAKELFDRAWGKAPQALEHSGKDGKDLVIHITKYGGEPTP